MRQVPKVNNHDCFDVCLTYHLASITPRQINDDDERRVGGPRHSVVGMHSPATAAISLVLLRSQLRYSEFEKNPNVQNPFQKMLLNFSFKYSFYILFSRPAWLIISIGTQL